MKQPKGFEAEGEEHLISQLQKRLYSLPQAGHIWNKAMNQGMLSLDFMRMKCEYCLYFCTTKDGTVLTGIHVDDFLLAASSLLLATNFKWQIASILEISDLGEAKFYVGIAIECNLVNHHIYLSQTALIDKIIVSFNMTDCNPISTPMEAGLILSHKSDTIPTHQEELELLNIPSTCWPPYVPCHSHTPQYCPCHSKAQPIHELLSPYPLERC
jgi:Reverse transcriptase (RNA-dependent DNA polymerase)